MFISKSNFFSTIKAMFRALGLEISFANTVATERNVLHSLFKDRRFSFVVDVGANTGQYGLLTRSCGYRGLIISFEPLAAAHAQLAAHAARDQHWTVADRAALGADAAHTTIYVAGNSVSSSLLDMSTRHLDAAPHSAFVATEAITVVALDDCIERYVGTSKSGLLKIDTQGYEMQVLRGAHKCLSDRIDVVQTELSLVELYSGQPLMLDVCNFLRQYNFHLRYIIPGLKDPVSGQLLQLDGIFSKN